MTHPEEIPEEENTLQPDPADPNGPTLEEALQQIQALSEKSAEMQDRMLRALAEAENTRRRAEKDRQDMAKFAVTSFARDMLSIADNLRRALDAVPQDQRTGNAIYEGVEATERELLRILEKNGIVRIDPMGQKFDPNLHEVMFEIPAADKEPGIVMQVVEPGYMIHERLLRPARVGIAKDGGARTAGATIDQQA
jgi:molecular chaperone GrpE